METKTYRKLAALAAGVAVTLGAVAIAPSATANDRGTWSGGLSCSSGQVVWAEGTRDPNSGDMFIAVPGAVLQVGIGQLGGRLQSTESSGSWEVYGTAATSGRGYCAAPAK
jgi:hypothetical protein